MMRGALLMHRIATLCAWTLVLVVGGSSLAAPPVPPPAAIPAPAAAAPPLPLPPGIDAASLRKDLYYLAADEMGGRRVGTAGIGLAADYLESRFRALGLLPAGEAGGFRQRFQVTVGTEMGSKNAARVRVGDAAAVPLEVGKEFLPLSFSDSASLEGAEVVFAGYGIEAPEFGYDDYRDLEVRGKVVLVLRDEPQEEDPNSVFGGDRPSQYSHLRFKALTAREKGAAGMVFVTAPLYHADEVNDLIPLRNDYSGTDHGLPAVGMRLSTVTPWLDSAGIDLRAWQQEADRTLAARGAPLPAVRLDLTTDLRKTTADAWNIVGKIPGGDPALAAQAIVVGAHYDHLGVGGPESLAPDRYGSIHNGADDNASGTAALLAVAEALRRAPAAPRRTVFLAAFSGEEEGLLGSTRFVRDPPVPLAQFVFMLNMDMVGRLRDDKLTVSGLGTGDGFQEAVESAAAARGLRVQPDRSGFGASDQTVFYTKGVPVLFLFTGPHQDYHRPEDDADRIVYEGVVRIAALAADLSGRFANAEAAPQFHKVDEDRPASAGGGRGYGPYFGSIPDFGDPPAPGVLLSGVRGGSPAEKAGVRAGDLIVRFAGIEVRNLEDYTFALRKRKPGDVVEVVVVREGQQVTLSATLEKRTE